MLEELPGKSPNDERRGRRIATWFQDDWPHLLRDAGSVGLAVVAVWVGTRSEAPATLSEWLTTWPGWLFVGSIAAAIVGSVFVRIRARRLSEVAKDNEYLRRRVQWFEDEFEQRVQDHYSIISDRLNDLANHSFGLGDTERISVYKHDGLAFVMLGRYSKNPHFDQQGRGIYPDSEGCIGVAWAQGEAVELSLPDPVSELRDYLEANYQKWGLAHETSNRLTMKSRSFAAFALEDRNARRIAVVVFESTRVDSLDIDQLRETMLLGTEGRWLTRIIELMKPIEPSPSYAYRKGF